MSEPAKQKSMSKESAAPQSAAVEDEWGGVPLTAVEGTAPDDETPQ